jgi:hypothetical protein
VGNGVDYAAQSAGGAFASAEGSFSSVTGVTNATASTFSLQLNTEPFTSAAVCAGSANPAQCQGWQQYVYSNAGYAFIQYWLLNYGSPGTACPAGWNTYAPHCWKNSVNSVGVPVQQITNLASLRLTGQAGATDTVIMWVGNVAYTSSDPSVLNLAAGWQDAEFNIFGDCCGSQVAFNAGSTVVVKTSVDNGTLLAPSCVMQGYTGETNSLTLVAAPVLLPAPEPAISFTETNVPPLMPATCATSIGDTHLTTFNGLFYDFQATGDFVLAQNADFAVQARQQGDARWPNMSVNKAVATEIGGNRVVVYLEPAQLVVNGASTVLGNGASLALSGGVNVLHAGNVYAVTDRKGDLVRAELNNGYMNVAVGVSARANQAQVNGLLGRIGGNVNQIEMRNGAVLKEPVAFADLYHGYADSWRVSPNASLFSGRKPIAFGIPGKLFFARDLDKNVAANARARCTAAGIQTAALLEACTLDSAVLQDKAAVTRVFARTVAPRAVIRPVLVKPIQAIETR